MSRGRYDVIVVGARCAGAPTAMLLARKGHRVLLVDKATFPSDTVSTHLVHPPGVAALKRWGLLERVAATACPPIHTYAFDLGPFVIAGSPGSEVAPVAYAPRRTVLDKALVDAASEGGVEVREAFTVEEILREHGRVAGIRGHGRGGAPVVDRAQLVVGADGLHSLVARAAKPEEYQRKPKLMAAYYGYWSGLPMNGRFEAYDRGDRSWAAWPTNDGLTLVIVGWPHAQFDANKAEFEGHFHKAFERAPAFAERIRGARREERLVGASVPGFFRKPFGPGWALVGDSGYNRDFITAQGISDAFRDAELCASALDESLRGAPFDAAMGGYQAARDALARPMFEFTCQFASFTPPSTEQRQLFAAIHASQEAMDGFARTFAGVVSPAAYFSEENVGRMLSAAPGPHTVAADATPSR